MHLAMSTATSDLRAVDFTPSRDVRSYGLQANNCMAVDSSILPDLLDQVPQDEQIGTVTADRAHDTRRCQTTIIDRQATPIIPIRKNGRLRKEDCPAAKIRNETLRATRHFGRAFGKRWTGYHAMLDALSADMRFRLWTALTEVAHQLGQVYPEDWMTKRWLGNEISPRTSYRSCVRWKCCKGKE
ncbi:Transposase DDE domain-containing protein [Aliiruegeria lutimaris]|uniref:Transposase DDE domain-containing protein n=1 Tax=Aliiruegeria lutimaris TaxID=571298 RepID=A0A1G9DDW0_9RHOB|nr:Transposase DDE domain-containing protein [Aliiruegeria lutimaris]